HLDVELVLVPVSGHGEFQRRGLQFLVFRMDWGAARPAFLGQRRRRDQHLVFSFHGAVVVPVSAQLKRAVRPDFSPRADLLAHGLEDHQTGGDRPAVLIGNFAADWEKSLAAAPAVTKQDQGDKDPSVPRTLSASARDHGYTGHHRSPSFGKTAGIKSLAWVGRRRDWLTIPGWRHWSLWRSGARRHRRKRTDRPQNEGRRIAGCRVPSATAPGGSAGRHIAAWDRDGRRCRGPCPHSCQTRSTVRIFRRS